MTRSIRVGLPLFTCLLAAPGMAQAAPRLGPDPYTADSPAARERAGYVSFGPFPFGTNHDSAEVAALLPDEPLAWVETAHFRIGCALAPFTVATDLEPAAQTQLRSELQRLATRLPAVAPTTRTVDGWLRTHLVAQRCEDLYREVQDLLGVHDIDFPRAPGDDPRRAEEFRGLGPYLGVREKFTVLLVRDVGSLQRYTAAYQGRSCAEPVRFHDHRFGCAFFGAAENGGGGVLRHDLALRTHLTFHVAHNLYLSYRSYSHDLPAWLPTGLAHWHARNVSTRFPIYDLRTGENRDGSHYATWGKRAATLAKDKHRAPLADFLQRLAIESFTMDDHLQSWALVDWLMAEHPQATMQFLHRLKDPFHNRVRFPTDTELLARQSRLLRQVFGGDAGELEEAWRRATPVLARR